MKSLLIGEDFFLGLLTLYTGLLWACCWAFILKNLKNFKYFWKTPKNTQKIWKLLWIKEENISEDSLHLQWKFELLPESLLEVIKQNIVGWCQQTFFFKSLLTMPSNVLSLHLKQTFPPIIWIFTEGEGDGIKSRLPF